MNKIHIENIAIAIEEGEDGKPFYQAHVFMAAPDYRCIQLDPYPTQEAAAKSVEDFLNVLAKVTSNMEESEVS